MALSHDEALLLAFRAELDATVRKPPAEWSPTNVMPDLQEEEKQRPSQAQGVFWGVEKTRRRRRHENYRLKRVIVIGPGALLLVGATLGLRGNVCDQGRRHHGTLRSRSTAPRR